MKTKDVNSINLWGKRYSSHKYLTHMTTKCNQANKTGYSH